MSDPVYGDQFAALRAEVERLRAALGAEVATSEGRCKVLFEKSDELRAEWQRAERAEAEVERLRQSLATVADAHERDLMRLAHALGFDHEPPASVDAMAERAKALRAEALKAHTTAERLTREAAGYEERLREERAENSRLRVERGATAYRPERLPEALARELTARAIDLRDVSLVVTYAPSEIDKGASYYAAKRLAALGDDATWCRPVTLDGHARGVVLVHVTGD